MAERLGREAAERQRALALIARRRKEAAGSATPSTVRGGEEEDGYADVYNRKEVEEVRRFRDRREYDRRGGGRW